MRIQASAENYLETILVVMRKKGEVHSVDVAAELGFSKPSVSVAMKNLRASGHIDMDAAGHITLTESGRKIAETIYERHTVLAEWLALLGVGEKTALEDACKLEHAISAESFEAVKRLAEAMRRAGGAPDAE